MNYRLTLAFVNDGANNNNNNNGDANNDISSTCLGGMMDVTIYKPLPHTGMGLSVSSWGKEIGCDVVLGLMKENGVDAIAKEEGEDVEKEEEEEEKAHKVAYEMEEDREEVEPDAR